MAKTRGAPRDPKDGGNVRRCQNCNGTGSKNNKTCDACNGSGLIHLGTI